jgi:hypothetical protein
MEIYLNIDIKASVSHPYKNTVTTEKTLILSYAQTRYAWDNIYIVE